MLSNKQSMRSLVSFLVTWSFLVLTVTGLVLYIVPQGRVAYWIHWSLAGMEKDQWGWVHMMFGGVFIITGIAHLYFNWKPFKAFLAARVSGHLQLKREVFIATGLTVAIFVVSALDLPPASWIIDLNDDIKASWITAPELEPPFGHAESVSLAALARRMSFDLQAAMEVLAKNGVRLEGKADTLEAIARRNNMTPMAVYALIQSVESRRGAAAKLAGLSAEEVEARLAGTGLGRKSLGTLCAELEVGEDVALARLRKAGISAETDDKIKAIAEAHGLQPIDLALLMLDIER